MFAIMMDLLLAALAVIMLFKGHYGITRQAAWVPLAVALIDISVVGSINPSLTPALSALLVVLQIVVLGASGAMLRQDVVRARNKRARRLRRQEVARSREAFEQALGQRQSAPARRVCA